MGLTLTPQRRAMLDAMGVSLGWPSTGATPLVATHADFISATGQFSSQVADTPQRAVTPMPNAPAARPVPPRPGASPIASPPPASAAAPVQGTTQLGSRPIEQPAAAPTDWATWLRRVQACQACALGVGRIQPVLSPLAPQAPSPWMVVGDPPDPEQALAGQPFVGAAGALLDAMLRAVGASRQPADGQAAAHLALALRCCPARPWAPDDTALALCRQHIDAELALVRPSVIVTMGRWAMRLLLSQALPPGQALVLAQLRGQVWHYQGVPVVVTYPPSYLLTHPQDKAKAWDDLKLARSVVQGNTGDPPRASGSV